MRLRSLLLFLLATVAFGCQSSSGGADGDADIDADTDMDSDGDVDTDADTDGDVDTDADTDTGTGTGTGSDTDTGPLDCSSPEPGCGDDLRWECPAGFSLCLSGIIPACHPDASCDECCGEACVDRGGDCSFCDPLEICGGCSLEWTECDDGFGGTAYECPPGYELCFFDYTGACIDAAHCDDCCTFDCDPTGDVCG